MDAQDYGWWNTLVQWDGKTPWQEYLDLSTSGLGPNALPVPTFNSLGIPEHIQFHTQFRYHHYTEDPTYDVFARLDIPFSDRIAIAMWMVPIEHYNTSDQLRDARRIRQYEANGFSSGDFYFGTYFHVLKEEVNWLDILVSANFKTASGNNLEGGRFTDTPGYFFDATYAKTFTWIRPYFVTGLYVYQTYDGLHFQNDAFLYALGSHFFKGQWEFKTEWAGYIGYLEVGDRPSVLRVEANYKSKSPIIIHGGIQFGLNDLDYTTLSFGINYIKK